MKVIYCPPGQDPMLMARQTRQRRSGGGLTQYWWMLAVAIFIAVGFMAGPFRPKKQDVAATIVAEQTPATAEISMDLAKSSSSISVKNELASIFDGFCRNPSGGWIANGDAAWITDGDQIKKVRCDNGTWQAEETAATP